MRVTRDLALVVHRVLDNWVPPVIRDSRWFMYLPMRLAFGRQARELMTFRQSVFNLDKGGFADLYRRATSTNRRATDLNRACVIRILRDTQHREVLDVGCGRGYLAGLLSRHHNVTVCDLIIPGQLVEQYPAVNFVEGNIECLPFVDGCFDTVICTHTLEHVQDLGRAVSELRRVARRQLIVVVPKQRPYQYHVDLHTYFFPYRWSLQAAFGHRPQAVIDDLGDWYYEEQLG